MRRFLLGGLRLFVVVAAAAVVAIASEPEGGPDAPPTSWRVVWPQDVRQHLERRRATLDAALKRKPIPLRREDFQAVPPGRLGQGVHGESVLDGVFILGYSGSVARRDDLCVTIESLAGNQAMHLIDRVPQAGVYARLVAEDACAVASFDVISPRGEPMTISLGAYQAVLVVPSQDDWKQWFGKRPYQREFVYLAGTGSGYAPREAMRDNYRPILTRALLRENERQRIRIEWNHNRKEVSVWIDDRQVVRNERFLSNTGDFAGFVALRPGSFLHDGLRDNGEFYIDNVRVDSLVWSAEDGPPFASDNGGD